MRRLLTAVFISSFLCIVSPDHSIALTVTVGDNLADNLFLTAGQTVSGRFDINSAIPNDGSYIIPYDIVGASATFIFYDDFDTRYTAQSLVSSDIVYSGDYGASYNRYDYRTYYNYYYDDYEGVTLQVSSQVSTDGTNWYSTSPVYSDHYYNVEDHSHTHSYTYDCSVWWWPWSKTCTGYITHNVRYVYDYDYYDITQGYTGRLIMTSVLDASGINDLSLDGIVEFTVSATSGDIYFGNGTLTAELNPNAIPVPEPTILLLVGTGVLCAIGYGRRKKISQFSRFIKKQALK